jgi:hypothetical protein
MPCRQKTFWANGHRDRVQGIVYMEAIVTPLTWADWPENARRVFQGFRSESGEEMILEKNMFVERVLPSSVRLSDGAACPSAPNSTSASTIEVRLRELTAAGARGLTMLPQTPRRGD